MKILVVGPSWVGDSVMAQTLYKRIKKELPSSQIDVMSPHWSQALLERMPEVTKKIVSPFSHGETKLLERYKLGQGLKKENYDRAIVLTNSLKSSLIPYLEHSGNGLSTNLLGLVEIISFPPLFTPQSNPRYFASPTKLSFLSFHTFLPPDVVVAL